MVPSLTLREKLWVCSIKRALDSTWGYCSSWRSINHNLEAWWLLISISLSNGWCSTNGWSIIYGWLCWVLVTYAVLTTHGIRNGRYGWLWSLTDGLPATDVIANGLPIAYDVVTNAIANGILITYAVTYVRSTNYAITHVWTTLNVTTRISATINAITCLWAAGYVTARYAATRIHSARPVITNATVTNVATTNVSTTYAARNATTRYVATKILKANLNE